MESRGGARPLGTPPGHRCFQEWTKDTARRQDAACRWRLPRRIASGATACRCRDPSRAFFCNAFWFGSSLPTKLILVELATQATFDRRRRSRPRADCDAGRFDANGTACRLFSSVITHLQPTGTKCARAGKLLDTHLGPAGCSRAAQWRFGDLLCPMPSDELLMTASELVAPALEVRAGSDTTRHARSLLSSTCNG